ncbi:hypothetical protein [Terrabacter sp. Soil810]|uniref:hypothetical protein n=1 Tax=Terrabacter sp. Soil810 TaxID=1736418 RepID=UPI000A668ACF|nr:hypothetical protein [Terrabacter sp. Soil810]
MTERSGGRHAFSRRPWLYVGVGLALVLALIVFFVARSQGAGAPAGAGRQGYPSPSPTSSPSAGTSAAKAGSLERFDGSDGKTTTTFKAASNWQINWEAKAGNGFTVELLDKQGVSRGEIVTAKKKAKGSTFVSEGGEFKLKVTASGPWTIGIVGRTSGK